MVVVYNRGVLGRRGLGENSGTILGDLRVVSVENSTRMGDIYRVSLTSKDSTVPMSLDLHQHLK